MTAEIQVRKSRSLADFHRCVEIQREVWGESDLEIEPYVTFVVANQTGGQVLCAFDGDKMVGFTMSLAGVRNASPYLHSHMTAVIPTHRDRGVGRLLKLLQREEALGRGIRLIEWTFDPLQSLNAHLNIAKLGVIVDSYRVDYYGETTSFLHGTGTDRLWVTWSLNSERVRRRIEFGAAADAMTLSHFPVAVRVGEDFEPELEKATIENPAVVIEIPDNINLLNQENSRLALKWREATRQIFTRLFESGHLVAEYYRTQRDGRTIGSYLLAHQSATELQATDEWQELLPKKNVM